MDLAQPRVAGKAARRQQHAAARDHPHPLAVAVQYRSGDPSLFDDQFDERGAAPDDDTAAPGGQQEAADQGLSPSGGAGAAYPHLERPRRNDTRHYSGLKTTATHPPTAPFN